MDENIFNGIGLIDGRSYLYDGKDTKVRKEKLISLYMSQMLTRTQAMFKWEYEADKIPRRILEGQIQRCYTGIINVDGDFYQTFGALGADLDYNYMPTKYIVANPYLINKTFTVNKDVVIIPNDSRYMGLYDICRYYASLLAENVISKIITTINSRAVNVFKVKNNTQYEDVKRFLNDLIKGEQSAITQKEIYQVIETLPFSEAKSQQTLTQLIEDQQYIKACWFNDLGVEANYNMKREAINSNEAQLSKGALTPFVDDMLQSRKEACKMLKKVYGLDWNVEFNSSWALQTKEEQLSVDFLEKEVNEEPIQTIGQKSDENEEKEEKENEATES